MYVYISSSCPGAALDKPKHSALDLVFCQVCALACVCVCECVLSVFSCLLLLVVLVITTAPSEARKTTNERRSACHCTHILKLCWLLLSLANWC